MLTKNFRPLARRLGASALVALFALAAWPAHARESDTAPAKPPKKSFNVRHPLPFKFGETLKFDVKFSRFPISANVGELTFTVGKLKGSDRHVKFEVSAVSRGALVSLFGVKVRDVFTSLADRDDLYVYSTTKNLHENDFRQQQQAVFDRQAQRVRYSVITPGAAPGPAPVENATQPWVQDVVSAIYFARTRKLKNVGREVHFPVSDEGQTYDIGVALAGREQIKVDAGTFQTIKVDARIFNGRYIRRDGQLFIWFTDDARRVPVKAQLKSDKGTVTFVLTSLDEGEESITPSRPVEAAADDEE
jgi:hypothetical protein